MKRTENPKRIPHFIYTNESGEIEMAEGKFTPTELASELGISPKECRKFLRSLTKDRAGKGGRWSISADTFAALIERYPAYVAGKNVEFSFDNE